MLQGGDWRQVYIAEPCHSQRLDGWSFAEIDVVNLHVNTARIEGFECRSKTFYIYDRMLPAVFRFSAIIMLYAEAFSAAARVKVRHMSITPIHCQLSATSKCNVEESDIAHRPVQGVKIQHDSFVYNIQRFHTFAFQ